MKNDQKDIKIKKYFDNKKKIFMLKGAIAATAAGLLLSGCKTTNALKDNNKFSNKTENEQAVIVEGNRIYPNEAPNEFKPLVTVASLRKTRANMEYAINNDNKNLNPQIDNDRVVYKRLVISAISKDGELKTFNGGFYTHKNWSDNQIMELDKDQFLHSLQEAAKGDYPEITFSIELATGELVTGKVTKDSIISNFENRPYSISPVNNPTPKSYAARYTSATYSAQVRDPKTYKFYTVTKEIPQKYFEMLTTNQMEEVIAEQLICFHEDVNSLSSFPTRAVKVTLTMTCADKEITSEHTFTYYSKDKTTSYSQETTNTYYTKTQSHSLNKETTNATFKTKIDTQEQTMNK